MNNLSPSTADSPPGGSSETGEISGTLAGLIHNTATSFSESAARSVAESRCDSVHLPADVYDKVSWQFACIRALAFCGKILCAGSTRAGRVASLSGGCHCPKKHSLDCASRAPRAVTTLGALFVISSWAKDRTRAYPAPVYGGLGCQIGARQSLVEPGNLSDFISG